MADDLDRLFSHLVLTLAQESPNRLEQSFQIAELYQSLIPYRQHRSALGLHSHQDYEMAILRLLAGERGYASVEPREVQQALAQEAEAINPETGLFREYAAARVRLNRAAVNALLEARAAYSPSVSLDREGGHSAPFEPPSGLEARNQSPRQTVLPDPEIGSQGECRYCGILLPAHRSAAYCPSCGLNLRNPRCRSCGAQLESSWRYCIECGWEVRKPGR